MRLSIVGRPTGKGVDQQLLRSAINFYSNHLFKDHTGRLGQISVKLSFIPSMFDTYGTTGCAGWYGNGLNPDNFYIDLDAAASYETVLITGAHEITHVKQMAMGHRTEDHLGVVRWYGQPIDVESCHYYDLPWEIEALGREYGLYDRFNQEQQHVVLPPAKTIDVGRRLQVA
jgi:hypothetical protein